MRDRALVILSLALVGGAIVGAGWAYRLWTAQRGNTLAFLGLLVALASVLVSAITLLVSLRPPPVRPVDALADELADAVRGQWWDAANERRLVRPKPIPIRWSLNNSTMAGPVKTAVCAPGEAAGF